MPDSVSTSTSERDAAAPARLSARELAGRVVSVLGMLSLPLALGAVVGFYWADQGMRFLPTMLEIVLAGLLLGFVAMPLGRLLQGSTYRETRAGSRLRKRVVTCIILGALCIAARLALYWTEQPSPLTNLTRTEFDTAFELDGRRYRELDQGLRNAVAFLKQQHEMFDAESPAVLSADQEELLLEAWSTIYDHAFLLDQTRSFYEDWFRFDPSRAQRSYHLRSFLLTFAAELALYENSTELARLVLQNDNAVKFLDGPHPSHNLPANSFSRFREELQGMRDQARVVAGEKYLLALNKGLGGHEEARGLGCSWLWDRVERHLATIDGLGLIDRTALTVRADLQVLKVAVDRTWYPAQSAIAEWMGDTRVRRIGEYLITPQQVQEMDRHLLPGDVMLSRKNWYLSNVGLPGFWPHAILYIGEPAKFDSYFDDPEVLSYLRALNGTDVTLGEYIGARSPARWLEYQLGHDGQPNRVIEALSEGVVLNTLEHSAGDYIAALRPRLSKLAKAQAIIEAFGHLGKPYDFDFDFATDHALVCTEVVWRCYRPSEGKAGLTFPLVEVLGRATLPANNIAELFATEHGRTDAQMDFVYFIDAHEKQRRAFVSTEGEFLKTARRTKWDISLD